MHVIVFRVCTVVDPFVCQDDEIKGDMYMNIRKPSWSISSSSQLSDILNRQCKYNQSLVVKYKGMCKRRNDESCKRFSNSLHIHVATLKIDEEILSGRNDGHMCVLVLDRNRVYRGHCYTRSSPTEHRLTTIVGLRDRVDLSFLKNEEGVMKELLEGSRRFSLIIGRDHMAAVDNVGEDEVIEKSYYMGESPPILLDRYTLFE